MPLKLDEQLLNDAQEFYIYFKLCIKHVISNTQCVYFSVFKYHEKCYVLQVLTELVITERTGCEGATRRTNSVCKC